MKALKKILCWTATKPGNAKRPRIPIGSGDGVDYPTALAARDKAGDGNVGILFSDETSDYIAFDVDVGVKRNATETIPPALLDFLKGNPTHVHYSPGGKGLHFIYRLRSDAREYVQNIDLKRKTTREGDMFLGEVFYNASFMTVMDREHELSTGDKINAITLPQLQKLVPSVTGSKSSTLPDVVFPPVRAMSLTEIEQIMEGLPSTYNTKVERCFERAALEDAPGSDYEYWVFVGNCLAHGAISLELCGTFSATNIIRNLFLSWSQSGDGFESDAQVLEKFEYCLSSTRRKIDAGVRTVSMRSLRLFKANAKFEFPVLIMKGKRELPDPESIVNVKSLMEYEGLELRCEYMGGSGHFFTGDDLTLRKWFNPKSQETMYKPQGCSATMGQTDLQPLLHAFLQDRYGFSVLPSATVTAMRALVTNAAPDSIFKRYIESEPWDGVKRFEDVYKSLAIAEGYKQHTELYQTYTRNALLSAIGVHFFDGDDVKIPAMLVLTGQEFTYKTTWGNALVPDELGNFKASVDIDTATNQSGDWSRYLSSAAVVVLDECEEFLSPKHESRLKQSVDSAKISRRKLYDDRVLKARRTALIVGTTNKSSLFTSLTGSRKTWIIPVSRCNTEVFKGLNYQQLYAEILHILRSYVKETGRPVQSLWELDTAERKLTNAINLNRKGFDSGLVGVLTSVFGSPLVAADEFDVKRFLGERQSLKLRTRPAADFGEPDESINVWTVNAMKRYLEENKGMRGLDFNKVKYALAEYSGVYTSTLGKPKKIFDGFVREQANHLVMDGAVKMRGGITGYLMPPVMVEDVEITEELKN